MVHIGGQGVSTETEARLEVLGANPGVPPHCPGDLANIGRCLLTDTRDGVDAGYALGQEGVGNLRCKTKQPYILC